MSDEKKTTETETPKVIVEPNLTDLLKSVRSLETKMGNALTDEKAREILADVMAKSGPFKTPEKEEVIVKAGNRELVEFDPDAPQTLEQIHKSESKKESIKKAQELMDDAYLVSQILKCDPRQLKMWNGLKAHIAKSELEKAMTAAGSGSGAEWIPTGFSADLVDKIRLDLLVANMFQSINMTQNPFTFPRLTSDSTAYLQSSESSATTESTAGTGNNTLNAIKLMVHVVYSTELSEDSIVAILNILKPNVIRALADGVENAIINGDVSGTHQDSDVTAVTDTAKSWKGLRFTALATTSRSLATFNYQTLLRLKQDLGTYGANLGQLFWCTGPKLAVKLLNLKDEQNNPIVATRDVLGDKAAFITGQLASMGGVQIITSPWMRENLNATGVYDGTTTTKGTLLICRKDAFVMGWWRRPTVKTKEEITTDDVDLVATLRADFEDRIPDTETTVAIGYNIDPTA